MNKNKEQYIIDKKAQMIIFNGIGILFVGVLAVIALSKNYYALGYFAPMILFGLVAIHLLTQKTLDDINRTNME